ncbi:LysR family transcriptional regulator [Myxococcus stipitatus DSM 14675]|uniref:LysR family transcriptional regulator n=1 Tax=Myxococcus stipitatus (strain DSM 14675 / JCM 12634 / Mx s8) TaxID=1278073 RepID=L7U4U6_MYXSD|nr:LysR family transcriptional regulator [Myxococcus stipitatus]AGC43173.1 LysR family transcriptional regulator [Myxococcus stipitatus DSM 14675]
MNPALLPSLAWFAHVASHRSFTKAAAQMGVSRAALSQNLKALEKQLGVRLLNRTTRDMSLTEDGQHLFDALLPSLGTIESAVRGLGEAAGMPSGLLKVNTARMAARYLIEPHLGEFLARYPNLSLELVMDDGLSNIIASGCDAGIRLGQSLAEHMVAVPVSPMLSMAVVGAPSYFARRRAPKTPADLVHHNCINYRHAGSGALHDWEFTAPGPNGQDFSVATKGNHITNDDDSMLRAALQGVGLIQHIDQAVQRHLDDGSLVRVLQPWCPPFPGFYLYVPSRKQLPKKVQALMGFLVDQRKRWEGKT